MRPPGVFHRFRISIAYSQGNYYHDKDLERQKEQPNLLFPGFFRRSFPPCFPLN